MSNFPHNVASVTADQIALWGSTVTVACTINDLQPLSASEILWYKDSPEEALPGALSQVVGNSTTSRLTLSVVTDEDTGTYYCALPSDGKDVSLYKSSRVVVGSKLNNSHFHIISLTGGKGRVKDWLRRRRRRGRGWGEGVRGSKAPCYIYTYTV